MLAKCKNCGADVDVLSVGEILKMGKESNAAQVTLKIGPDNSPHAAVFFILDQELIAKIDEIVAQYD